MNLQVHLIVVRLSTMAMLLILSGCTRGGSTSVARQDRKIELSLEEKSAVQRDQQLMESLRQISHGQPGPGLPQGATPASGLEYWAALGNIGKVKLELQQGADIQDKFANGDTALHVAALNGHVEMVQFLLTNGADRTVKNDAGATPLELARLANQAEIAKLLEAK